MKILYVFPEPLPLPRARGIQVANTVAALAQQGLHVCLAYVPAADNSDPIAAYGLDRPRGVELIPLSRGLSAPFSKLPMHSNRLFFYRLQRWLGQEKKRGQAPLVIMVRHLKIAQALLRAYPEIPLLYEAHEVFADVAPAAKRESLAQIESTVLHDARAVIAITHAAAADLKKRYQLKRELQVLPDAVAWPAQIPQKPWQQAGQHIIYAGSFFPWKGTQDLIAAAKSLRGCRITLLGGSPERVREYQSQVAADGAELMRFAD
ncbi:MAG: glycosyltransferase [Gammaproteobacteria bacterium]|nr:glycosyltransferase [Gammaproteobacteria bacterium]